MPDPDGRQATNKVARLIERHDLSGLPADLESRWLGEDERMSLRELADFFNRKLLAAHLREARQVKSDEEIARHYEVLTDDSVSSGERTRERRNLERMGVDVDQLYGEFVTHQTMHSYLTEYRDVEYSPPERASNPLDTIGRLRGRVESVTQSTIDSATDMDQDYDVFVDITVFCDGCERQYTAQELIERGGCECPTDAD